MRFRFLSLFALAVLGVSGCVQQSMEAPYHSLGPGSARFEAPVEAASPPAWAGVAEPRGVVTLSQALESAMANSPQLKAFSWDVRGSQARRLQAGLAPNPLLQVSSEDVGGTGSRKRFDSVETTIRIAQPIESARKREKRMTLAAFDEDLAKWDYESRRLDLQWQVSSAFTDVLAAQESLALNKELVRIAEQAYRAVTQRVAAGSDSPIEQTKSGVAQSTARIDLMRAERTLESAREALAATWGSKGALFTAVAGEFEELRSVPSVDELGVLVGGNPDIARWGAEKQRRIAALKLEKARAVPNVTFNGGIRHFNETDDSAAVFGFSIPLPVSNRNQGAIREATYMLAKTEESRRAAEVKVHAELAGAAQRLAGASAEATALKNDVLPGAQRSFDDVTQAYRSGKFDYLQVLDAQRTLFTIKGRYIKSLTAFHKATVDIERLIGQSLDLISDTQKDIPLRVVKSPRIKP